MQTVTLHPDDIEVGERHRALASDEVQRLAVSIEDIGLRQPISVRVVEEMEIDGHITSGVPVLVAGAHRLAAIKSLGWNSVECIEVDDDELTAEMWEIAENLHRLDLTKAQRDEHIRRYAELIEARGEIPVVQSEPLEIGYGKPPPRPKGVARQIADETGLSKSTIHRALNPSKADPPKEVVDVHEMARRRLMGAWNAATDIDRAWFRDWIDGPVMDVA